MLIQLEQIPEGTAVSRTLSASGDENQDSGKNYFYSSITTPTRIRLMATNPSTQFIFPLSSHQSCHQCDPCHQYHVTNVMWCHQCHPWPYTAGCRLGQRKEGRKEGVALICCDDHRPVSLVIIIPLIIVSRYPMLCHVSHHLSRIHDSWHAPMPFHPRLVTQPL